ncbi:MAG: S24/S26 family peptidase [Clostridia bacterium]|nr:S24/S26 family peptidase [Clostridia bacterium]
MKTYDINEVELRLKTEPTVAYLTSGASMRPLLKTNRDIVVISKPQFPLKIGDVALYKKKGVDRLILHRVIGIQPNGDYITRGDNTYHKEYIPTGDVIGIMTAVYRRGKHIDCAHSKGYKFYIKINKFFYPVRWLWYTKIRATLGKIKRLLVK